MGKLKYEALSFCNSVVDLTKDADGKLTERSLLLNDAM
jgi:hypothetical protein